MAITRRMATIAVLIGTGLQVGCRDGTAIHTTPSAKLAVAADNAVLRPPGSVVADEMHVPAGTVMVGQAMLIQCNSGLVAVVRVPMSASDAIAWLDDSELHDSPVVTVTGHESGRPWVAGAIGEAGGYSLSATAVQNGSESDVFITECGD